MDKRFISDFQIIGSSIKSVKIKNDFILMGNKSNLKRKLDLSHSIVSVDTVEEGRERSGIVVLNIKVIVSEGKKKYVLEMAIEGCFNAPIEMDRDVFIQMLNVNGITSLYSIARGFVHGISAQTLAAGSIMLPMINVVAYSRSLDSEQSNKE